MGCDYYIVKYLCIYFNDNDNDVLNFEIERERGYFGDHLGDEDEDDYEKKREEYIKGVLTPQMKPITIYNNGMFNKPMSETKYRSSIEQFIKDHGKKCSEITKIIKEESRYERS
jgi:hypothetical protein